MRKTILAALLFAGTTASLQAVQEKTDDDDKGTVLLNKIAAEVIHDAKAEKISDKKEIVALFVKKMRAHEEDFRALAQEDCLRDFGKEKESQCHCVIEKRDYDTAFVLLEEKLMNRDINQDEAFADFEQKEEATYQACGLDFNIFKQAKKEKSPAQP